MSEFPPSTDILRLFQEDLTPQDRAEAFQRASAQINQEVKTLATVKNRNIINKNFDIKFIFNSHSDGIDAGQTIREIQNPFITFIEGVGGEDLANDGLFRVSTENAFNMSFNGTEPMKPPFQLNNDNRFHYWRDRGLLAKGSIMMPIDIRHYSRRILDALMGNDYDQSYLNSSIPKYILTNKTFPELLEETKNKGLMILYSNSVRELTSTKQILETLLLVGNRFDSNTLLNPQLIDKVVALSDKKRQDDGKLSANIIYGSGHHGMTSVFRSLGIQSSRVFSGREDLPDNYLFTGSTKDQFFSSHAFKVNKKQFDIRAEKYAKQHIIESILWCPLDNTDEYGFIPENDSVVNNIHQMISYIARRPELVEHTEELLDDFRNDPMLPVKILTDYGIKIKSVAS